MSDIAIRVENLSKLYHLGALHQRPDTLRDALTGILPRITRISRNQKDNSPHSRNSRQASQENSPNSRNSRQASGSPDDLWALRDVSPEVKRGEVVGTPALASGASVIGRNGAGTLAPARSAGESTLLKIPSRITEPTSGSAETCGGRVGSLLDASQGHRLAWRPRADRPREHPLCVNGATLRVGMHRHEIQRRFDEIVAFAETPS